MKWTVLLLGVALTVATGQPAFGAQIEFGTVTLGPADTMTGPAFAVPGGVQAGDTIGIETTNIMYLQTGNTYGTNAAGVVVVPGSAPIGQFGINPSGPPFPDYGAGTPYGDLLLGNPAFGFFAVYPTDASTGAGSSAPPTDLRITLNLGSFGGGSLVGAPSLEFLLSDTQVTDNSGYFTVSSVPEPVSASLMGCGLLLAAALRRRRKA
jgi:hypothetical protein